MAATYEPIASQTLGSDTATVSFTGIASDWTDIVAVVHGRSARSAIQDNLYIQFNSDTTATNYSLTRIGGNGSSAYSERFSGASPGYNFLAGLLDGSTAAANTFSPSIIHVQSYANTNVYKTWLYGGNVAGNSLERGVGLWRNTSAISTITFKTILGNNFKSGCTFSLFGLKAA